MGRSGTRRREGGGGKGEKKVEDERIREREKGGRLLKRCSHWKNFEYRFYWPFAKYDMRSKVDR